MRQGKARWDCKIQEKSNGLEGWTLKQYSEAAQEVEIIV